MARYSDTAVFQVQGAKVPLGPDVLSRRLDASRTRHRFSYCDGTTLTVSVERSGAGEGAATTEALLAVRDAWRRATGQELGRTLTVRSHRSGVLPTLVSVGRRSRGRSATSGDDLRGRGRPPEDPDDGGLAGVREPRRPRPGPGSLSAAREEPRDGRTRQTRSTMSAIDSTTWDGR